MCAISPAPVASRCTRPRARLSKREELTGKARRSLAGLIASFERWRGQIDTMRHTELAELILDESGYTAMWQADKSPQAHTRLENLKELIRFMHDFESLSGFIEHVSLVMDAEQADDGQRVTLMTLHAAKGLEFDTVFLPGWEERLFPHQRSLDESGLAGLEEERRLAYVGITRARKQAHISFAQNRRTRGLFQAAIPSRFVDELPVDHVEVVEAKSPFGGRPGGYGGFSSGFQNPYGSSRFDRAGATDAFEATYETPGWQRAKTAGRPSNPSLRPSANPNASRPCWKANWSPRRPPALPLRHRRPRYHNKFGTGTVTEADGNKLTSSSTRSAATRRG